ncbi:hypothetical protein H0H92_000083 [Tricholoma furcatifolium]|nr:hypothetical protein H0H92_000083 [Tricholoma furcatifolium]
MDHPLQTPEESRTYASPSELEGVPQEYFVQSLRSLAPSYWDKPETSDCTISSLAIPSQISVFTNDIRAVIPVPQLSSGPLPSSTFQPFSASQTHTQPIFNNSSGPGRRATWPALEFPPHIRFQLHVDYLATHSSYIRALLSGANPLDLIHTTADAYGGPQSDLRYTVPANRMPRLITGLSDHPTLYLPIPDPSSFRPIVHWMYFGDTSFIADCLRQETVHWEGLARNAEYLGVSPELRVFLKMWYYDTMHIEGDDSDTACSDSEMEEYDSSTASEDESMQDSDDEKEPCRGRPRIRRPLSYQEPGIKQWAH